MWEWSIIFCYGNSDYYFIEFYVVEFCINVNIDFFRFDFGLVGEIKREGVKEKL